MTGARGEVRPDQVMGESRPGRKLVLAGDTAPCEMTAAVAHDADLLIHEATFLDEEAERARLTRHATAGAADGSPPRPVCACSRSRTSPRGTRPADIRDEARAAFERTIVPRDFDRVVLPFRERGEPEHVRGDSA